MIRLLALPIGSLMLLSGCSSAVPTSSNCSYTALATLTPTPAVADHNAASPANQIAFAIAGTTVTSKPAAGANCAFPQVIAPAQWTSSDSINAPINSSTGIATCTGTTVVPVMISVTQSVAGEQVSGATTLTCK